MVWLVGCGEPEVPSLLPALAGRWVGAVVVDEPRPASASFEWDEDEQLLTGELELDEADGPRAFTVLEARSVEDLGVALSLIEVAGVREGFVDALVPLDPLRAVWRVRWFCAGEPDGYCDELGELYLEADR
ncbi:MAG: hypothetical protein ABMA64_15100 [Myxococcota bacterium]